MTDTFPRKPVALTPDKIDDLETGRPIWVQARVESDFVLREVWITKLDKDNGRVIMVYFCEFRRVVDDQVREPPLEGNQFVILDKSRWGRVLAHSIHPYLFELEQRPAILSETLEVTTT